MEPQQPTDLEIQTRIIRRAATDANFRQQLLANGRATIEKELGIELPTDLEIQVIEETPSKLCLVLPMKEEAGRALSDEELKSVAAGSLPIPIPMPTASLPGPLPMPVADASTVIATPVYSFDRLSVYIRR